MTPALFSRSIAHGCNDDIVEAQCGVDHRSSVATTASGCTVSYGKSVFSSISCSSLHTSAGESCDPHGKDDLLPAPCAISRYSREHAIRQFLDSPLPSSELDVSLVEHVKSSSWSRLLRRRSTGTSAGCELDDEERSDQPSLAFHRPFASVRQESTMLHDFEPLKLIGKGSYAVVCEVKCKRTDNVYAMKILEKNSRMSTEESALRWALTELSVLRSTSHPYIVPLLSAFQTRGHLMLVMKVCPGGDMKSLIMQLKRIDDAPACLYVAEVLLALCHLHDRGIMHRDVKPDNVLLDEDCHAMLADFGIAREGARGEQRTGSFCGSLAFCSPEVLQRQPYGASVDIYGLGALLYTMLVGRSPFWAEEFCAVKAKICSEPLEVPEHVSEDAASLIKATMERDPQKRLGAECTADVQRHTYFSSIDWAALLKREVPMPKASFRQRMRLKMRRLKVRRRRDEAKVAVAIDKARCSFDEIQSFGEDRVEVTNWEFCVS